MSDVVFVQMPFADLHRPSLALGLFTSTLRAAGISTESHYANIDFAETVGVPAYYMMGHAAPSSLLGEWIFAAHAWGRSGSVPQPERDLGRVFTLTLDDKNVAVIVKESGYKDLDGLLFGMRQRATAFVEELARRILGGRPRVVACTSMFDQHAASLSLLTRIKALAPEVLTVIGGANCAGAMGRATHLAFPALDFTVTGEFDQFAAGFFQALVDAAGDAQAVAPLPPNVLGPVARQEGCRESLPPSAILTDMDAAAVPDYDDYFERLYSSSISDYVLPSLPLETSRGCWWGAKQHCTFCGLNAEGMSFRKKSPERALAEIRGLTKRYGINRWSAADNIIDMSYFQAVLPQLAAERPKHLIFYETKANLKREHVQALADAGCFFIQPGLESLHDETLKIMRKGATACGNLQLLKYCLEFGVVPAWSVLCGFPRTDPKWVAEVGRQMPALFHLPPPIATIPIRFDRFSPYHQQPEEYGIELEPLPAYRLVYPLEGGLLNDLAYFFRQVGGIPPEVSEHARVSSEATTRWRASFWGAERPVLEILSDDGVELRIRDTRACAVAPLHELNGSHAALLRLLETPASWAALMTRLGGALDEKQARRVLDELCERQLVWRASTQFLALPTPRPLRPMQENCVDALGKLDVRKYVVDRYRFKQSFVGAGV